MKKLEKIIAVAGFVIGISLVGIGLYNDNKRPGNYVINTIVKSVGLLSFASGAGLGLGRMLEEEDRRYFRKNHVRYPR